MAKKKKTYIRIDCSTAPLVETKPPRDLRPKCLNCDQTILMRKSWWNWDSRKKEENLYYYSGESYFCCRNCALAFAHKSAQKLLKVKPLNEIQ